MDTTDGREQAQVRSPQALLVSNRDDNGCTRINALMHRVPQSWNETASSALLGDGSESKLVPLLIGLRKLARDGCQYARQKAASVFCDAKEARAATQQTRCHRTLERIPGAVQGQASRDRSRGKAVIGQRDEHRLEHTHLLRCRSLLRGEPEGQFAEPDLPHQLAREIVTKQVNAGGIGGTYSTGKFHMSLIYVTSFSALSTQDCCQGHPG